MEKLTIGDVASALGVSKTTVSRAISGKGRISAETTERVQRYIREHNYKPNVMARGLAQQKTYNIGVVCPIEHEVFNLPYFHHCMYGISDVLAPHGYDMLICMIEGNHIGNLRRAVENHKVDGVILTRTLVDDKPAEYLKESGVPFVVIGSSPDKELVQIDNDHFSACCELTSILIGKGYKKLMLIGGEMTHIVSQTRLSGFQAAFEKAGLPVDEALLFLNTDGRQEISEAIAEGVSRGADGIICMDEKICREVLTECKAMGIDVPKDLKLASFYNTAALADSVPAVTALDVDDSILGATAANTLFDMLEGRPAENKFLRSYQIILRESTS